MSTVPLPEGTWTLIDTDTGDDMGYNVTEEFAREVVSRMFLDFGLTYEAVNRSVSRLDV